MEYIEIFFVVAAAMVLYIWLHGPEEREDNIRYALVVLAGTVVCMIAIPYS